MPAKPKSSTAKKSPPSPSTRTAQPRGRDSRDVPPGDQATPIYASDAIARKTNAGGTTSANPPASAETETERKRDDGSHEVAAEVARCLGPIATGLPIEERGEEIGRLIEDAFVKTSSWVVFYRWMLSPGGVASQLYPTPAERRYFETTDAFANLLELVTSLRSTDTSKNTAHEPERVITVRMPRSVHEAILAEAETLELGVNKFCITKLLQPPNKRYTPLETGNRRGRRPGPQIIAGKTKGTRRTGSKLTSKSPGKFPGGKRKKA